MGQNNAGAHVAWINKAADKRHAAIIMNHGKEVARLWDHTPEEAQARAQHLIELQRWRSAEVVLHAS